MRMIFGVSEPAVFLLVLFGWAGLGEAGHYKKAGECPVASPYTAGVCSYDCSYDAECEDDKKCCSTGCGMVCQSPVFKDALSKGAECPKVSYRKDTYGNTWPMTSFIYCDTGCCGSRDNQDCCDEDKDNRTGLYVGVVAASLVLIVATISVTCCFVHRYNRKNVMVGINAGTHYQMQPQIAQYSYPTAPPLYEQAVATGGQTRNSNITHSRSNPKLFWILLPTSIYKHFFLCDIYKSFIFTIKLCCKSL